MNLNRTALCQICHKHIGKGYDHSDCAKVKQQTLKAKARKPRKLSKGDVNHLSRIA